MPAAPDTDDLLKAARKAFSKPFGAVIRLEPEGGGVLWVDGRGAKAAVVGADPGVGPGPGLCVWRASRETLIRILEGERLLASSFVSGRLLVAGDMSVMARLQLESGS